MSVKTSVDMARFIFTTGKLIQDQVFKAHAVHFVSKGKAESYGELSMPQMHAIMIVRTRGQVSMRELAEGLGVSAPSASVMVDRLVERGVLSRRPSRSDRRKVVIRIAETALDDIVSCENKVLGIFVDLVEKIGPETAQQWCDVLKQVARALEGACEKNTNPARKGATDANQ